jgi:hypothetical protein
LTDVQDYILQALEHVYPGLWEDYMPGFAAHVVRDNVGLLVCYEEPSLKFASGTLTNFSPTNDFLRSLREVNIGTAIGSFHISEGQVERWQLIYTCKLRTNWIEVDSRTSAQMLVDIVSNVPAIVNDRASSLQKRHGGQMWTLEEGWQMALMSHF